MLSAGITISAETLKAIGEFSINWSVFEAIHCNSEASAGKLHKLDLTFGEKEQMVRQSISAFRIELSKFFSDREWAIDNDSIKYCLYTEVSQIRYSRIQEDVALIQQFLLNETDDYHAALLCIQRIRNNFFHGTKEFYHLDNQCALFQIASNVLYNINCR